MIPLNSRQAVGRLWMWAAVVVLGGAATGQAGPDDGSFVPPDAQAIAAAEEVRTADVAPADLQGMNLYKQAGCSTCGSGLFGGASYGGMGFYGGCDGCGEAGCFPGRPPCDPCCGQGMLGRAFCAFHDCLCCPDPCYEPRWVAAANAALFVDTVRPSTQTRFRWDSGRNMILPDRAEYFWGAIGNRGPGLPETGLNYHILSMYVEAATERFSFFIDTPYRSLDPDRNGGAAGFGDLSLGTKSLLLDCELMQLTFQFTTFIPTASAGRGLGTGHVSLEPSLLTSIKLHPDTYYQGQLAQWIPIGGTQGFQGGVLHTHHSINHVLARPVGDTQLIGTFEVGTWSFQSGSFTDPVSGLPVSANGYTYASIGPGIRLSICDKIDIGFGAAFSVTRQHFADQLYRTELRWRF